MTETPDSGSNLPVPAAGSLPVGSVIHQPSRPRYLGSVALNIVGPDAEAVPLHTAVRVLAEAEAMLRTVDAAISGDPKGTLNWFVANMAMGSLRFELGCRAQRSKTDEYAEAVPLSFCAGLRAATTGSIGPAFSEPTLKHAKKLGGHLTERRRLQASVPGHPDTLVTIDDAIKDSVASALDIAMAAQGSVIGQLITISVASGRTVIVRDERTRRTIRCQFDASQTSMVKDAFGVRVQVSGVIRRNRLGEPVSVLVHTLEVLPSEIDASAISAVLGRVPDLSGDVDAVAYVQQLREA